MSRQSKKGSKTMNYVKITRPEDLICPRRKISAHGVAGAAVGAVVGGVCAGEGGAVVGGLVGYAVGACLEPKGIEDMIFPLYHK